MSSFIPSALGPEPRRSIATKVALLLAGIMTILALNQLFSFEKFPDIIQALDLPGVGDGDAVLIAALIVIAEVLAVPFLLRMRLSRSIGVASMVASWLVALWWIAVTLWQNLTSPGYTDVAFLGATVPAPIGWWAVCLILGVGVLTVWASWGLWPLRRKVT